MKEPSEEVKEVERRYEKALDDMEKHYKDVLDKIRAEISKQWYMHPKNKYEEGLKDQALKDIEIIDKYKR